jgi:hypothetical protein
VDAYLREVNTREAEEAPELIPEPTGNEPWPADHTRIGSGEIRIRDVVFLRADGQVSDSLLSGEPATVRMTFEANEPMDDITFGLAFITATGTRLAGPNSGFGSDAVEVTPGTGTVEFTVDELLLHPSHYRVSAAAVTRHHVVDHIESGFDLTVHAARAVTEAGLVRMPGRWTVTQDGA